MKAYQVFDENIINDNIKYKIGKKYRKSELLNQRPFLCYKVIPNINIIENPNFKIYNVEVSDICIEDNTRIFANEMEILDEIDYEKDIDKHLSYYLQILAFKTKDENVFRELLDSERIESHMAIALSKAYKYFDELMEKKEIHILKLIAREGIPKYLNELCYANDFLIREAVAKNGMKKYLDILVNDKNEFVRTAVAKTGIKKYLDILIKDMSYSVKEGIASTGQDEYLDVLLKEEDDSILLSILDSYRKSDLNFFEEKALSNNFYLKEFVKFGKKDFLDKVYQNESNEMANKIIASFGYDEHLDFFMKNNDKYAKLIIPSIKRKKDLDELMDDKNAYIRAEVAKYGDDEHLDCLVSDKDPLVLKEIIKRRRLKDLEFLSTHKNKEVSKMATEYLLCYRKYNM